MTIRWGQKCYPHVVVERRAVDVVYFRLKGDPGLYVIGEACLVARVDGGDPGDEQPATRVDSGDPIDLGGEG